MSIKTIYLIRHGQTEYNKNRVVQGSGIDASLNETGKAQAEAFYAAYKDVSFDKVYISTLKRTLETVQGFLDLGIPHERLPGLNEISWGIAEGTPFSIENANHYQSLIDDWKNGNVHLKVEGGESPLDVMNRQKEALKHILSQENEQTILICMHGRAMRILLCWLQNRELSCMDDYAHDNCGLYLMHHNSKGIELKTKNDIRHLIEIQEKQ